MSSPQIVKKRVTNMSDPKPAVFTTLKESRMGDHTAKDLTPSRHGRAMQIARLLAAVSYFLGCCMVIVVTQFLGVPLYWINRDHYYAYMALTKRSFLLVITTITQWWSPTFLRISGDESVVGQIQSTLDGGVEFDFPDRIVMIANHQLYSDWLYLWWTAYANRRKMHGHIFIILRESLKYIPILGQGMMFFGFIFMSRKLEKDKPRLAHRLNKLKEVHHGPLSGHKGLDPMWLMLFPEGTNLSNNGRKKSASWAEKQGISDMQHQLLPRSTGTFFCLNELKRTVDWVYDCTMAYEGIPRDEYGQDIFTLKAIYIHGKPPKSVNMYWRRFAVSSIPLDDPAEFDKWLLERWREKDALMEQYMATGRFPGTIEVEISGSAKSSRKPAQLRGFVETYLKQSRWWEFLQIFTVLGAFGMVANLLARVWNLIFYGRFSW